MRLDFILVNSTCGAIDFDEFHSQNFSWVLPAYQILKVKVARCSKGSANASKSISGIKTRENAKIMHATNKIK